MSELYHNTHSNGTYFNTENKKPSEDGLVDNAMQLNFVARYSDF
jgi:hypothetical protein